MSTYTWATPEYSYDFIPVEHGLVRVQSDDKQAIDDFLSTLELAGPEEGTELPETIYQEQSYNWGNEVVYFVEVTRPTISLFLDFDVRYYMGTHAE
jgi:hypothetical protein